uniref:Uncharacterized protein n=1 Tax=Amphimedon queenslandica TaxID=400682 RepID=A0A1X7TSP7_AMPQE
MMTDLLQVLDNLEHITTTNLVLVIAKHLVLIEIAKLLHITTANLLLTMMADLVQVTARLLQVHIMMVKLLQIHTAKSDAASSYHGSKPYYDSKKASSGSYHDSRIHHESKSSSSYCDSETCHHDTSSYRDSKSSNFRDSEIHHHHETIAHIVIVKAQTHTVTAEKLQVHHTMTAKEQPHITRVKHLHILIQKHLQGHIMKAKELLAHQLVIVQAIDRINGTQSTMKTELVEDLITMIKE